MPDSHNNQGVLVDMEEGVIGQHTSTAHRPRQLFDADQCVTSTDGSGNNWYILYFSVYY